MLLGSHSPAPGPTLPGSGDKHPFCEPRKPKLDCWKRSKSPKGSALYPDLPNMTSDRVHAPCLHWAPALPSPRQPRPASPRPRRFRLHLRRQGQWLRSSRKLTGSASAVPQRPLPGRTELRTLFGDMALVLTRELLEGSQPPLSYLLPGLKRGGEEVWLKKSFTGAFSPESRKCHLPHNTPLNTTH